MWLENATKHIKVLQILRREFRAIRELWYELNNLIIQHHNRQMSKPMFVSGITVFQMKKLVSQTNRVYGNPKFFHEFDENITKTLKLIVSNLSKIIYVTIFLVPVYT